MFSPGRLDLSGYNTVPFEFAIAFEAESLVGASINSMVRLYPNAPGEPVATFDRSLSVATVDGVPTSTITLKLSEVQMSAMPRAGEIGNPMELAWDLVIQERGADQTNPSDPANGRKYVALFGRFTVIPGVTNA